MTEQVKDFLLDIVALSVEGFTQSSSELKEYKLISHLSAEAASSEPTFASVISFKNELISGSLISVCNSRFLDKSHPNHEMGMPVGQEEILDWSGEVANQLLGRVKNLLANFKVKFDMGTPTTVTGQTMAIAEPKDGFLLKLQFEGSLGPLVVYFQAIPDPRLVFETGQRSDVNESTIEEGESIFF
jgi:CheY-specific phosphatase CheX